jgi:hypothetical protein
MRAVHNTVLMLVLIVISFALIITVPLGIGWILTLFLPFSLFEGTLLAMLAVIVTWRFWRSVYSASSPEFDEEVDSEPDEIPSSRFWETSEDKTWENWYRYVLANSIYEEFLTSSQWMEVMDNRQLEEMSIRLADASVGGLRKKSARTKRLRMSKGMLKQELGKMGHQPYDDEILEAAVVAMNVDLAFLEKGLRGVMRDRLWDEPAEVRW